MSEMTPFSGAVNVDRQVIARMRGWFFALGAVLLLIGIAAVTHPVITTVVTVQVLGILLLLAAIGQGLAAFQARGSSNTLAAILTAALYLFAGVVLLTQPALTAEIYTLFLVFLLFAVGVIRIAGGLVYRLPGWGFNVFHGAIVLLLAILLWQAFPASGLWVIGLFVGIELIFAGLFWIMLAASVKNDASVAN